MTDMIRFVTGLGLCVFYGLWCVIVSGFVYRLLEVYGICVLAFSSTHKFKIMPLLLLHKCLRHYNEGNKVPMMLIITIEGT